MKEWCKKNGFEFNARPPLLSELLEGGSVSEEEYLASLPEEQRIGWKLNDAQVRSKFLDKGRI